MDNDAYQIGAKLVNELVVSRVKLLNWVESNYPLGTMVEFNKSLSQLIHGKISNRGIDSFDNPFVVVTEGNIVDERFIHKINPLIFILRFSDTRGK